MAISGINDYFYDIVFGLEINNNTYNYNNKEFINNLYKNIFYFINILFNIVFLFIFLFCLIFIEIPILMNKKEPKKTGRFTRFKENIENNEEQIDNNEKFTAEPVL